MNIFILLFFFFSSELDEVYEQFNQWLNDPIIDNDNTENKNRELDSRDLAVIRLIYILFMVSFYYINIY